MRPGHVLKAMAEDKGLLSVMGSSHQSCCHMDEDIWQECWDLIEASDFPLRQQDPSGNDDA